MGLQNPTGTVPTEERYNQIYALAQKHDLISEQQDVAWPSLRATTNVRLPLSSYGGRVRSLPISPSVPLCFCPLTAFHSSPSHQSPYFWLQFQPYTPDLPIRQAQLDAHPLPALSPTSEPDDEDLHVLAEAFNGFAGVRSHLSRDVDGRVVRLDTYVSDGLGREGLLADMRKRQVLQDICPGTEGWLGDVQRKVRPCSSISLRLPAHTDRSYLACARSCKIRRASLSNHRDLNPASFMSQYGLLSLIPRSFRDGH